jgi:hypothetical protein
MDQFLISLIEARKQSAFEGSSRQFKGSRELVEFCIKNSKIVESVHPSEMNEDYYNYYFNFLVEKTLEASKVVEDLKGIDDLKNRPSFRKVFKILWDFGVIGEIRNKHDSKANSDTKENQRSPNSITIKELYVVYQVKENFSGSELAFKKQVQKLYGSFAEYCLVKGYDINTSKWESDETAIRVAKKLGSKAAIQAKSKSLYNYLNEKDLWNLVFEKGKAA